MSARPKRKFIAGRYSLVRGGGACPGAAFNA